MINMILRTRMDYYMVVQPIDREGPSLRQLGADFATINRNFGGLDCNYYETRRSGVAGA